MRLWRHVVVGAVLAGAGFAYYVQQRSASTGLSYREVLRELPGEMQRFGGQLGQRTARALGDGLSAARSREDQVDRQLAVADDDRDLF